MDNVESNQTPRHRTQETGSISIVPTLKGSESTLFSCWRVPIRRDSVCHHFVKDDRYPSSVSYVKLRLNINVATLVVLNKKNGLND